MDYNYVAQEILKNVGGNENVTGVLSCFTRVRIEVKDKNLVSEDEIKKLDGVQGVSWMRNQCQIIMGGKCSATYDALVKIVKISDDSGNIKIEKQSIGSTIVDYITSAIQPIIPVLIGAGMIQGIVALLGYLDIDTATYVYQVVNACGQAGYYFLPIFLGFSAATKLRVNPYLGAFVGAVLVFPDLVTVAVSGETYASFLGIPVTLVNYGSSIAPILLSMPIVMLVEKGAKKISPDILKAVLVPALTIIISVPIVLIVTGPAANIVSNMLGHGVNWLYTNSPIIGGAIIGLLSPYFVLTGVHQATAIPIVLQEMSMFGYTILFPLLAYGNAAIAGSALGVAIKTKKTSMRSTALSATVIGAIGITEPALYGVLLPNKKPLISIGVMAGICGALTMMFKVKAYGLGLCGLGGIPIFLGPTFAIWAILMIVSYLGAAAITYVIGFDEDLDTED